MNYLEALKVLKKEGGFISRNSWHQTEEDSSDPVTRIIHDKDSDQIHLQDKSQAQDDPIGMEDYLAGDWYHYILYNDTINNLFAYIQEFVGPIRTIKEAGMKATIKFILEGGNNEPH